VMPIPNDTQLIDARFTQKLCTALSTQSNRSWVQAHKLKRKGPTHVEKPEILGLGALWVDAENVARLVGDHVEGDTSRKAPHQPSRQVSRYATNAQQRQQHLQQTLVTSTGDGDPLRNRSHLSNAAPKRQANRQCQFYISAQLCFRHRVRQGLVDLGPRRILFIEIFRFELVNNSVDEEGREARGADHQVPRAREHHEYQAFRGKKLLNTELFRNPRRQPYMNGTLCRCRGLAATR
jgi:hypothetical protein